MSLNKTVHIQTFLPSMKGQQDWRWCWSNLAANCLCRVGFLCVRKYAEYQYVRLCVCVYVCMYVCTYVSTYVSYTHMHPSLPHTLPQVRKTPRVFSSHFGAIFSMSCRWITTGTAIGSRKVQPLQYLCVNQKNLKKLKRRTKKVVSKKVEESAAFAVSMCKQKWLMFLNAGAYVSGICISIV